jgi:hypothetical protein
MTLYDVSFSQRLLSSGVQRRLEDSAYPMPSRWFLARFILRSCNGGDILLRNICWLSDMMLLVFAVQLETETVSLTQSARASQL